MQTRRTWDPGYQKFGLLAAAQNKARNKLSFFVAWLSLLLPSVVVSKLRTVVAIRTSAFGQITLRTDFRDQEGKNCLCPHRMFLTRSLSSSHNAVPVSFKHLHFRTSCSSRWSM